MLESELQFYLKTHLDKPSSSFVWSDEDNSKLFEYLNKHRTGELSDEKCKFKIKQAFKEYFEPVGYILFKMNDSVIRMKVFPYKIEPKDSVNLLAVINILDSNEDLVEFDYKGKVNQICIPKMVKDQVYHFISKINNEELNRKELLRYAVRKKFRLKDHDIVIVKNDQIFIKILAKEYKKENEKRYNGIKEEELKSIYINSFEKEENKDFFLYVAKLFVQIHLLEKKINNLTYEKKVFSQLQEIIVEQLSSAYTYDKDFNLGFAGYIFRIHFQEVFGYIADLILGEIATSNQYMIDFLKYYSSNMVLVDEKKYKVPEIQTESGLKWNIVSMLSIAKIYTRANIAIETYKNDIDEINKKIKLLHIGSQSPIEFQKWLEKEIKKLTDRLFRDEKKLDIRRDSLESLSENLKITLLKEEIRQMQEDIKEKKEKIKTLKAKYVKKDIISQYINLERELTINIRNMNKEEKRLEQNEPSYLLIKSALMKALISKKKLIEPLADSQ